MPYFRDPNDDRQQNDEQTGLRLANSSQEGSPVAGAQGSTKQNPTGSHFQNLDNYLSTNDAQGFGQKVQGKVQGDIDQGRTTVDQSVNQVKNQVNQNGVIANPSDIQKAIANPTQADPNAYHSWINDQYTGPKSVQDNPAAAGAISGAVSNAQTKAGLTGTEAGRFSLLDSYFGRPNYNFGEKSLDNLLVQRGGGLNTNDLQSQASNLNAYANQQGGEVGNAAAARAGQVEQTRSAARNAIGLTDNGTISGGAIGGLTGSIDARTKLYNDSLHNQATNLKSDVSDDRVTPETLAQLGLSAGDSLYGVDLSKYLQPTKDATKESIASPEDYSRYLALSQLAGVDPTYLTSATQDQAGKAGSQSLYDKAGLMERLGAGKYTYDQNVTQKQSQIADAQKQYQDAVQQLQASQAMDGNRPREIDLDTGQPISSGSNLTQQSQQRVADAQGQLNQLNSDLTGINHQTDRKIQVTPNVAPITQPTASDPYEDWINNSFGSAYTSYR